VPEKPLAKPHLGRYQAADRRGDGRFSVAFCRFVVSASLDTVRGEFEVQGQVNGKC
jgi:hypothetical protein